MGKRHTAKSKRNIFWKKQKVSATAIAPTGDGACASPDQRAQRPPGEVNLTPSGLATNNLSPCTGIGGESITDVSIDVTEDTAHSLATNAELGEIREAEMRNNGNRGDSDIKREGYDHMRLFTDARIEAKANNENADVDTGLEEDEDNFSSNIVVPDLQEGLAYDPPPVGSSMVRTRSGGDLPRERRTKANQHGKTSIIPASGRSTRIAPNSKPMEPTSTMRCRLEPRRFPKMPRQASGP